MKRLAFKVVLIVVSLLALFLYHVINMYCMQFNATLVSYIVFAKEDAFTLYYLGEDELLFHFKHDGSPVNIRIHKNDANSEYEEVVQSLYQIIESNRVDLFLKKGSTLYRPNKWDNAIFMQIIYSDGYAYYGIYTNRMPIEAANLVQKTINIIPNISDLNKRIIYSNAVSQLNIIRTGFNKRYSRKSIVIREIENICDAFYLNMLLIVLVVWIYLIYRDMKNKLYVDRLIIWDIFDVILYFVQLYIMCAFAMKGV